MFIKNFFLLQDVFEVIDGFHFKTKMKFNFTRSATFTKVNNINDTKGRLLELRSADENLTRSIDMV